MTDKTKVSDLNEMDSIENELLCSSNLGYNIDSTYIINPKTHDLSVRSYRDESFYSLYADKWNEDNKELIKADPCKKKYPGDIKYAVEYEVIKDKILKDKLAAIRDNIDIRVICDPASDPFTMEYCRTDESGKRMNFNTTAVEQLRSIKQKTGNGTFTMVINPYTEKDGVHVPETNDDRISYFHACKNVLDAIGSKDGSGIVLELGNEMNVSQQTKDPNGVCRFKGNSGFAKEPVDPKKYGDWYYTTVQALKAQYPELKCSIAGTAHYDKQWIDNVVHHIDEKYNGCSMIDEISFHPYRNKCSDGTDVIENNNVSANRMSYDKQKQGMQDTIDFINSRRPDSIGPCTFTVGEVSYNQPCEFKKSVDMEEIYKQTIASESDNYRTAIWPARSMTNDSRRDNVHLAEIRAAKALENMDINMDQSVDDITF